MQHGSKIEQQSHQNQYFFLKMRCKIDRRSFIGAILAQDRLEHRFYMIWGRFGVPIWESKIIPKSIPKSIYFQASLETLFSTIGEPKSSKMGFQNKLNILYFLELDKTLKSCSRFDGNLVFRGLRGSKSGRFFEPFS